jgi:hypothetical protein
VLGCRRDEQCVRQVAASGGAAGGVGRRGRIRVNPDHERVRTLRRGGEDGAAVARAQVERDAGVLARQASDVAGVELVEHATANHAQHGLSVRTGSFVESARAASR